MSLQIIEKCMQKCSRDFRLRVAQTDFLEALIATGTKVPPYSLISTIPVPRMPSDERGHHRAVQGAGAYTDLVVFVVLLSVLTSPYSLCS